jgi:hypothetical protein
MNNNDLLKKLNELFGSYRAEWLKEKIFHFFAVPPYFMALKDNRPCVLQGGRGTGKTTVLRGLSYQGQYAILNESIKEFDKNNFIGIYHRINTNHVRAFIGEEIREHEWQKIFSHYFNLIICREILFFIKWHKEQSENDEIIAGIFCNRIARSLQIEEQCNNFENLIDEVETAMYEFQAKINNISDKRNMNLSMAGDPIKLVTECATSLPQFKNKIFYLLIDEYENLTEYQQRSINSLIKHNTDKYTFKIGVRELGWKIRSTLNEQESLNDPADFVLIDIEEKFNNNDEYFEQFAKDVCQQRIEQLLLTDIDNLFSIEEAFISITMEEEAIKLGIENSFLFEKYKTSIKDNQNYINKLPLLYQYFFTFWAEKNNKSYKEMITDYIKNKSKWNVRYDNYKYSLLFKIRKGRGKRGIQKYYAGWNTYIKLAHGNIRYLMELVYRAYEKHLADNNISMPISIENQTITAQETGRKNLIELEGLCKNGAQLTRLILGFGRLFNVLESNVGNVAPEINQFAIKGKPNSDCNDILRDAVMYLACIRIPGNKPSSKSTTKDFIYSIHPIYAPFFMFSHRQKRKMEITSVDLLELINETPNFINKIVKQKNITFENLDELPEQLEFFKEFYEND